MVDAGGYAGGAEAVVYVYDGHVGGAAVQHAEERGDSVEAGAVAYAGGDGDDRNGDEAAYYAGECAFHAGDTDDYAGFGQFLAMVEQAVDAGYAYVIEAGYAIAHEFGGKDRFFGYGHVAGTGGNYADGAFAGDLVIALDRDRAREFVEFGGAVDAFYGGEDFLVGAGD